MDETVDSLSALTAALMERGLTAPFTSPALVGARVRRGDEGRLLVATQGRAEHRHWRDVAATERVTLHDRLLCRALEDDPSPALTPRAVWMTAVKIAEGGSAGRAASRAAAITALQAEEDRLIAQFLLVVNLLEELGVEGCDWRHLSPSDPAFHRWLASSVMQLAPALTSDKDNEAAQLADWLADWLERLSVMVAAIGLPGGEYVPHARRVLEDVATFRDEVRAFASNAPGQSGREARALADIAHRVHQAATAAVANCHAAFEDLRKLHDDWPVAGHAMAARCDKLEWLLDGWRAACVAWAEASASGPSAQQAALREVAAMIGVERSSFDGANEPLASTMIVDKIYRNELLKASAP